ncbi:alpha/beta fold hydrolase [Streptomyces sp. VRA16 Mangrove soil]|uniref:alpha/beta fold hydrolase n=1 Tax=Streptomyces sp. VRA16 Mangrove soil TaxID=2817434 RepID=UPI001A9E5BAD|nr:alpha/beta fold hydrolase [Streptomyces sp. VRA16 Mangrove soil]MBO1333559.1 alpha/beta fold hydrolase [Streptomyces sp. VRA16 Mangrove soil]
MSGTGIGATAEITAADARTVRGAGPGLLLAHGAGGSVEANYGPVLDTLAAGHTVVGVDYPGTGGTPRAGTPLRLDDLADQLVAAADAEGLDRFAVSGYSLGSTVAVRVAARHPERVTALLLTAGFAHPGPQLRLAAETWRTLAAAGDHDALARFLVPYALSEAALHALTEERLAPVVAGTAATVPPGAGDHADLVTRADVRADLARITAPTLVTVTTQDRLVPPAAQRELAAAIPGARVAELPTGHLPFAELPGAWGALMVEFLGEVEPRRP